MMGPQRMADRAFAEEKLGGGAADYDAFSRRGSFLDDDVDDEPMRRGSIGPDADPFIARRPSQGMPMVQAPAQIIEEADSDDEMDVRPRDGRINSMRRPGATSLEPMAFGRERAGTAVGAMSAPWSPNMHRDGELAEGHELRIDRRLGIDKALEEDTPLTKDQIKERVRQQAGLLRTRMNGDTRALFGKATKARPAHSAEEFQAMGEQLDYQQDESNPSARYLDPERHWNWWPQARPDKPNHAAFMSEPDAGWDRVQSRGFLGLPYFFSMLGSKLFGTKGGRYDRRQADLARRKGTFERAWETYGSNDWGKRGVMPDWIRQSDWARGKWRSRDNSGLAEEMQRMRQMQGTRTL